MVRCRRTGLPQAGRVMREEVQAWIKEPSRVTENQAHALMSGPEVPCSPPPPSYLDHYPLRPSWGRAQLLEIQVLKTPPAFGWTAQTSPYPGKDELPTAAAAYNGRGDPPAARWPGKERVKCHLARAEPPHTLFTPLLPNQPQASASPTSRRFLSLSSSCRRWVSRSPSSFRASSCRRRSSWSRSFSLVALRWIWRRETTMGNQVTEGTGVGQPRGSKAPGQQDWNDGQDHWVPAL